MKQNEFVTKGRNILELGADLLRKKEALGHGNWLPWLEANEEVLGFGVSAANKLMAGTRKFGVTPNLNGEYASQISREVWGNGKQWNTRHTGLTGFYEWYTPEEYVEHARRVMGGIDLDPASADIPQLWINAKQYFTAQDDGLAQEWHGRVWLNPPYSQPLIGNFVDKLLAEIKAGRVTQAILLTHSYTDTQWFSRAAMACNAQCFTQGRIQFMRGTETPEGSSPLGQAFTYYGNRPDDFAAEFEHIGLVYGPPINRTTRTLSPASTVVPAEPKVGEAVKELFLGKPRNANRKPQEVKNG